MWGRVKIDHHQPSSPTRVLCSASHANGASVQSAQLTHQSKQLHLVIEFSSLPSDLGHKLGQSSHLGGPFLYVLASPNTTRPSIHPQMLSRTKTSFERFEGVGIWPMTKLLRFPVQEPHLLRSRMQEETKTGKAPSQSKLTVRSNQQKAKKKNECVSPLGSQPLRRLHGRGPPYPFHGALLPYFAPLSCSHP